MPPPPAATPGPETALPAYLARLQAQLGAATRSAASLPSAADLGFHTTLDRALAQRSEQEAQRVLRTTDQVLEWIAQGATSFRGKSGGLRPQPLEEPRQLGADEFAATFGDVVDHLLERTDSLLDEYLGRSANQTQSAASSSKKATSMRDKNLPLPPHILRAPIDPRPQDSFRESKPDNRAGVSWSRPLRFGKPNALQQPDGWKTPAPMDSEGKPIPCGRRMGKYIEEDDARKNPYYYEILAAEPPKHAFVLPKGPDEVRPEWGSEETVEAPVLVEPVPLDLDKPKGEAGVPFTWVSDKAGLEALLAHLLEPRVKEIAVDLEHHSQHSFQGLTSLMQLTTRWGDYIIDTLQEDVRVHAEMLNQVFTDPEKVKILHGADADVLWLQRDLGLYLAGLFDTYHAATVLQFPQRGLAYLLSRYTGFEADKRFQLADWRIRPMPDEMLFYARSDTHSLIYVYDRLRAELASAQGFDAIRSVFKRSKSVAFKVYAKSEWAADGSGSDGWAGLYRRHLQQSSKSISAPQPGQEVEQQVQLVWPLFRTMLILRELHHWRDSAAREEDESNHSTLAARSLLKLAQTEPRSRQQVMGALGHLSPLIQRHLDDIATVVKTAWSNFDAAVRKATGGDQADSTAQLTEQIEAVREALDLPDFLITDLLTTAGIQDGSLTHPMAHLLAEGDSEMVPSTAPLPADEAESQLRRLVTDGPRVNAALFTSLAGPGTKYSTLFARHVPNPASSAVKQEPAAAPKSLFDLPANAFGSLPQSQQEEAQDDLRAEYPEVFNTILSDFAQSVTPLLFAPAVKVDVDAPSMEPESVAFVPAEQRVSAMGGLEASSAPAPAAKPEPGLDAPLPPAADEESGPEEMLDDETKLQEALTRDSVRVRKSEKGNREPKEKKGKALEPREVEMHDFTKEASLLDQPPAQHKKPAVDKGKKGKKDGKKSSSTSSATVSSKTPAAARAPRKPKEFGSKSFTFTK